MTERQAVPEITVHGLSLPAFAAVWLQSDWYDNGPGLPHYLRGKVHNRVALGVFLDALVAIDWQMELIGRQHLHGNSFHLLYQILGK